jgi:hypothetical protein
MRLDTADIEALRTELQALRRSSRRLRNDARHQKDRAWRLGMQHLSALVGASQRTRP